MEGINVLSLFDGMSCGQIALDKAGIKVKNYFASEIDEYAIKITQKNYRDTIQLGDIKSIDGFGFPKIDLLMGGSPCQSFSNIGDGSGFDGKSALFFEFVRILNEVKPKYFLLENVVMKKEWQDKISEILGCQPIKINSDIFSAQNRPRLYWTNIPNVSIPKSKNLVISSVINPKFSNDYPKYLDMDFSGTKRKDLLRTVNQTARCLTATMYKGQVGSFCKSIFGEVYKYTPKDCEVLQTVPIGYTEGVSNTQRYKMLGNGWTVDVIAHIFKHMWIVQNPLLNNQLNEKNEHI
jgi:DNA (cytosine-5)-methyltransferase 3A